MGKSQPSGNTTVTQNSQPWSGQQPYLSFGYQQAQNLYNNTPSHYYPGETLAPVSPQTYQAMQLQQERALSGSPVMNASNQNLADTLGGSYLNSNPYLDATFKQAANATLPYVQAGFEGNGRYGSGAMANATADAVNNLATNIYGGNYQQERQRQLQASALAPQAAANDYQDINALANVGSQLQNIGQGYINEDISRFTGNQQLPWQQLGNYMGAIGGPVNGSSATTSPYFTNPAANVLGLGLGGLGLYSGLSSLGLLGGGAAGAGAAGAAAGSAGLADALPYLATLA